MYTSIALFMTATVVLANQDGGHLDVIGHNSTNITITPNDASKNTSFINISTSAPIEEENITCTTPKDEPGECVLFYLCDSFNETYSNSELIDLGRIIETESPCLSDLYVCCALAVPKTRSSGPEEPTTVKPPPKERQGCGWRNPDGVGFRITGDTDGEANFGEFPWMVGILKLDSLNNDGPNDDNKYQVYVGGGSLITPSVVLTTAHVATNNTLLVRAGEWDTQTTKEIYPHQDRNVTAVEIHKDFNGGTLFYDIALLFLAQPMDLAPNVGVVCLPSPGDLPRDGTNCLASGWGKDKFGDNGRYSTILKKLELPVVDRTICRDQLRKTRLGHLFELHHTFMCAGGKRDKDTCTGDGGSPLVCPMEFQTDRYVQSGMVAWGIGCAQDGAPGVYVNIAHLRDWIDDKIAGKGISIDDYSRY